MRFVASEWPGTAVEAFEAWAAGCRDYSREHRHGPLGDPVDVVRLITATRRNRWHLWIPHHETRR